jgi:hypothetical protein
MSDSHATDSPVTPSTHEKLLQWWADTHATLEEIGATAHRIAQHADHPASPLHGLVDGDDLYSWSNSLGEMATELLNIPIEPLTAPADPTAGLPALPRPEPVDPAPIIARADAAEESADRIAKLTDADLAEMVRIGNSIKTEHGLPAEAVGSDLMPVVQAAALQFVRRFFPDALHVDMSIHVPTGTGRNDHKYYSLPVLTWRHLHNREDAA